VFSGVLSFCLWFLRVVMLGGGVVVITAASGVAEDKSWPDVVSAKEFRVIDGDTIHTAAHKIRLLGIDAPEKRQLCDTKDGAAWPCGLIATDMVVGMLAASEQVWCRITGRDRYRRLLGQCFAGQDASGVDIQQALVRAGLAVAEYSPGYEPDEQAAKKAKEGMWRGSFLRPREWRRQH